MEARTLTRNEFEALLRQSRQHARSYAYRLCGHRDDADDIVQDAFANAWKGRATFDNRQQFGNWLHRIIRNAFLDQARQPAYRRRRSCFSLDQPLALDSEEMSYDEIASRVGISVGTVRSRIHRGRMMLHAHLDTHPID